MVNNTFVVKLCIFFTFLFLASITLKAQNPNFSGELSNLVTEDSRFGWIKIKDENKLNADGFFSSLSESNSLTQTFSFIRQNSIQDKFGTTHQLYQVHYQNIPIDDQYWVLHEKSGNVFLAQGKEPPAIQAVATQPNITSSNALEIILTQPDSFNVKKYAWEDATLESNLKLVTGDKNATHFPTGQLVWAKDVADQTYKLAYRFDIFRTEPISKKRYYIDANTRQIFREYDLLVTNCFESSDAKSSSNHKHSVEDKIAKITTDISATGKANYVTLNDGTVSFTSDDNGTDYTLKASNLGPDNNQIILTQTANNQYDFDNLTDIRDADNDWQDDPTAIGAHWGTEQVYDYFLNTHGRKSFDGAGAPMISYVNFGTNYVNAFWNGVNMTYGDGDGTNWGALTSIDVIAHEIAHGVTENNGLGGLIYYGESGALNESFSDIFGAVVEFEKHPDGGDWLMGEDFDFANNNGFRNLQNPSAEGDPANYFGNNWYTGAGDNGGVHINSGVQNYWFFLLTTGGTGTSEFGYDYDLSGIGLDKAAAICYRNLTTYMHPNATYLDARNGAIQAAIDLYGENSAEHQATEEAWCAVGIGTTCLPSFTVYTPTLNELIFNGTSREITWSSTMPELISSVRIEYTTETGSNPNWNLIVSGEPNDESYIWDIPNIHSTTMRVRVGMSGSGNSPGNPLIAGISPTFNVIPCAAVETFEGPENLELNGTATFTGLAPGDGYEWFINDVSISTNKDLSHTFTDYGAYKLTYKVINNTYNCVNTETKYFYLIPDDVCEARAIDLNTLYEGVLNGATVEPNEPSPPDGDCSAAGYWCNSTVIGSVWYTFVAPPSGLVNIITDGDPYLNNRIALYEGINCGMSNPFQNANLLDANDNIAWRCCNGSRIDKICLSPGNTYYIQVDAAYPAIHNPFTIIVEEEEPENPLIDEEINCSLPEGWSFEEGFGHNAGIYNYANLNNCFDCTLGNRGFGTSATTYIQLPQFDFSLENVEFLFFEYTHVPQNDTVNNELRVEIADA